MNRYMSLAILKRRLAAYVTLALGLVAYPPPLEAQLSKDARSPQVVAAVVGDITKAEYNIQWNDQLGGYTSPNRAQNLRFTYFDDGFHIERRDKVAANNETWTLQLRLDSLNDVGVLGLNSGSEPVVMGNRAVWRASAVETAFINEKEGMQQTFLVHRNLGSEKLILGINVTSDWLQLQQGNTTSVHFIDPLTKKLVVSYSGLLVTDATGKHLDAFMEVTRPDRFEIVVNAADAEYPVLIDPLSVAHTYTGAQTGAQFGYSVCFIDTRDSSGLNFTGGMAVGAPFYDDGLTDQGRVFVYYSDQQGHLHTTHDWSAKGDAAYAHFGKSLASANPLDVGTPDGSDYSLNGDGYADLAVGAPNASNGTGKVYLYYGTSSGMGTTDRSPDQTLTGPGTGAAFGLAITIGDITGPSSTSDQYADVIVGAPYQSGGVVYLYKGASGGPSSTATDSVSTSGPTGDSFGYSLAFMGAVEGTPSVVIGAPGVSSSKGAVYVYKGRNNGISQTSTFSFTCTQANAQLGISVAGGYDVDSNGRKDFAVGAPFHDNSSLSDAGRLFVFRQASGTPFSSADTFDGGQQGARLGYSLSLGIVNNADNIPDVVAGAPLRDDSANDDKGYVFVYYGRSGNSPDPSPDSQRTLLAGTGEHFGYSVSMIPKVGGTGDARCIAGGAPAYDNNKGAAIVLQAY